MAKNEVKKPYPGTQEAIDAGCTCPVMDNSYGHGAYGDPKYGFYITEGCPIHAENF